MTIEDMNKQGLLICGFAGIGKSTMAKKHAGWVDLESTPFKKDWKTYIRIAKHMADNGYNVMLSCHKELRQELRNQNIKYIVGMPKYNEKNLYLKRYSERGNTSEFINLMDKEWADFRSLIVGERGFIIRGNLEVTMIGNEEDWLRYQNG